MSILMMNRDVESLPLPGSVSEDDASPSLSKSVRTAVARVYSINKNSKTRYNVASPSTSTRSGGTSSSKSSWTESVDISKAEGDRFETEALDYFARAKLANARLAGFKNKGPRRKSELDTPKSSKFRLTFRAVGALVAAGRNKNAVSFMADAFDELE